MSMLKNRRWLTVLIATLFWALTFYTIDENIENNYLKWLLFSYFCVATSYYFGRSKALDELFKENKKQELQNEFQENDKENFVINQISAYQEGTSAAKDGDFQKAIDIFSKCIEIDDKNSNLFMARSLAYHFLKQYDKALSDIYNALALDQVTPEAYATKAMIEWSMGDLQAALIDYNKALSIDSANSIYFLNRGQVKRDIGDVEGAIKDLSKAIDLEPTNPLANQALTLCQTIKDDPELYKRFLKEKIVNNKM